MSLSMRLGKIKCAAIWVGLCDCIAALLILRSVGNFTKRWLLSSNVSTNVDGCTVAPTLACNRVTRGNFTPTFPLPVPQYCGRTVPRKIGTGSESLPSHCLPRIYFGGLLVSPRMYLNIMDLPIPSELVIGCDFTSY